MAGWGLFPSGDSHGIIITFSVRISGESVLMRGVKGAWQVTTLFVSELLPVDDNYQRSCAPRMLGSYYVLDAKFSSDNRFTGKS